jgi:hypothetical protein
MSEGTPARSRRGAHRAPRRKHRVPALVALCLASTVVVASGTWLITHHRGTSAAIATPSASSIATTSTSSTTTTQAPGPGFIAGKVTAVGDSVMVDYQDPLAAALPGIDIQAAVSRQWYEGEQILSQLKAEDQLGATVIVALSTNGPITSANFDQMMSILSGASRVIFVNTHVDQPWQDPNNQVLAQGVARNPNAQLVDWYALANENPSWFGADQTHLAINGPGATALASLIASKAMPGSN